MFSLGSRRKNAPTTSEAGYASTLIQTEFSHTGRVLLAKRRKGRLQVMQETYRGG